MLLCAFQTSPNQSLRFSLQYPRRPPSHAPKGSPQKKVNATMVVVLSYQRCGSTFFGQIFNANPTAWYHYEPLDAVYSSMYGTRFGWNVPSDINSYENGSARFVTVATGK